MKFPYGIADFYEVSTGGYFYADRTGTIPDLENAGKQLLFLRPRRFGKSLLLSMLENYYDLKKAEEFEQLFGHLAIGSNPTPKHNQYFVLKWDFSVVNLSFFQVFPRSDPQRPFPQRPNPSHAKRSQAVVLGPVFVPGGYGVQCIL